MNRNATRRQSAATLAGATALLALTACTAQNGATQADAVPTVNPTTTATATAPAPTLTATRPAQGSTASAPPATPTTCLTSQLNATFTRLPGTAAGSTHATITLTNTSTHTCHLTGTTHTQLTDAQHHPIKITDTTDTTPPATTITLTPGATASETLTYSTDGNPPAGQNTCTPTATYILITPPANTTTLTTPILEPYPHCPNDTITTTNLIPGTTGPQN